MMKFDYVVTVADVADIALRIIQIPEVRRDEFLWNNVIKNLAKLAAAVSECQFLALTWFTHIIIDLQILESN
jgi:hypothetical protein